MANELETNVVVQTTPFLTQRLQFNCDALGSLINDITMRVPLALPGVQPDEFYSTFCNSVSEGASPPDPGAAYSISGHAVLDFTPAPGDPDLVVALNPIYEGAVPLQAGGCCIVVWLKWYPQAQGGTDTFQPVQTSP